jgi:hypothetical protein
MKISEFIELNEELDEPVYFNRVGNSYKFIIRDKNLTNELHYSVFFNPYTGEISYKTLKEFKKISPELKKEIEELKPTVVSFLYGEYFNITGSGHVKKVFSTVIEIIKDYVNSNKPKYLMFSATEKSRIKFYNMLIDRIGKYTNNYILYKKYSNPEVTYYILKRR